MGIRSALLALSCVLAATAGAQDLRLGGPSLGGPKGPPYTNLGRPATADDIRRIDVDVLPDGRGLPPGSGTAEAGRALYARHCASCHGASGTGGPADPLVGGRGSLAIAQPLKTVGSFWPYATTLWDYINRAMPYSRPGSLSADEVYAVTAYVLRLNGLVSDSETVSDKTLAGIKMPNRDGFVR
jgi:cytochrome c